MYRYGLIQDGKVVLEVNTPEEIEEAGYIALPPGVEVGYAYDGTAFTPPVPPEPLPEPPIIVSRSQGLIALLLSKGLKAADIMAIIEEIPDETQREIAKIRFQADNWYRSDPMFDQLGAMIPAPIGPLDTFAVTELFQFAKTL